MGLTESAVLSTFFNPTLLASRVTFPDNRFPATIIAVSTLAFSLSGNPFIVNVPSVFITP
ncbi:hypothetical protein Barb4_04568 [Bacteroidales bacterium Barb4]|nr:hypothetical protein Barb4_04568 [Bacteroidales bacterium Barb4]